MVLFGKDEISPISVTHYLAADFLSPIARKTGIHPNPKENVSLFANLSFTRSMTFVSPKFKLVNLWQFPNAAW